ncbi:MAG: hypothetical protein LBR66_07215 [Candidatus Symbiothrix sp.]|jgi:hypothetical protein|nr:hypothetical protein [Candidatus Symbiothrix sp.]
MKKKLFIMFFACTITGIASKAQVTIGSLANPKATLDVVAVKTDGTTAEGIIAPRLDRSALNSKEIGGQYTVAQTGAIVYVKDVSTGTATGQTVKVTTIGYYYFDGAIWQPLIDNVTVDRITGGTKGEVLTADVSRNVFWAPFVAGKFTIGLDSTAARAALLDVKSVQSAVGAVTSVTDDANVTSTDGGLLLPRVQLVNDSTLEPFIATTDAQWIANTNALKERHAGLMVYNLTEDENEDFSQGIYYWDGGAWIPLQKGQGNAIFDMDCTPDGWQVQGQYIEGKELTTANSIRLKLNVTRKGVYSILLESNNGYYFTASGIFNDLGTYHIYALGQGTPIDVATDTLVVTTPNDNTPCTDIEVKVMPATATYTFSCSQSKVRGVYKLNVPLDNTNYIDLSVNVSNTGSYEIKTNEVDGISFYASGEFTTTGSHTVKLMGSGSPYNTKVKTMTITGNSISGAFSCTINVVACLRKKKYLALGAYAYGYTLGPNTSTNTGISDTGGSPVWKMVTDTHNFGALEESTFKIEEVKAENWIGYANNTYPYTYSSTYGSVSIIAASEGLYNIPYATLEYYLFTEKPDIVFIGYYNSLDAGEAKWKLLRKYLDAGGIIIANIQLASAARSMINGIFGLPYVGFHQCTIDVMPLTGNLDDPVINGPFGNLSSGKYWGGDVSDVGALKNIPLDQFYVYSSGWRVSPAPLDASDNPISVGPQIGEVTMCRHKSLNFFWCGEAAWYASVLNNTPAAPYATLTWSPFMYDPSNNNAPVTKPQHGAPGYLFPVDNAILFANLFAWALTEAEFNGINKD